MPQYNIQDFIGIIAKLRDPNGGCPWDLQQNYQTMIPHLLEESYEVVEAIEQQNNENLKEELGDLLLQVVFLCQLAQEENKFSFTDVVQSLCEKIIRRHPHVFGDRQANNAQEALQNWNQVKAEEHQQAGHHSILDNIPYAFPALLRAEKLQKRCSKKGFDWDNIHNVFAKVEEELQEVKQELAQPQRNQARIAEEMGDLLFACVNLSRHLACPAEQTLRQASLKFERRFRFVEQQINAQNKSLEESSIKERDYWWEQAKKQV
ncbi:nucleoside triphosphate pyrophosphohydrolase [Volucribacter amazonae]|uniref:Nucleoside triphosphate pyrophosphohydrolase n=1 Tax=Volucribacter amazonae TaxID=256731 RepID=A0A9X4SID3_9PAST|nr:nucleoside triphosphate pyrophosphohydrolase [Volucribacter amazonae]MDG6895500.1 nucleoside triphosphate pyrophosphohydrolase [Volucribacter amazonae]